MDTEPPPKGPPAESPPPTPSGPSAPSAPSGPSEEGLRSDRVGGGMRWIEALAAERPVGRRRFERQERRLARLAGAAGPLRRLMAAIAAHLVDRKAHERLCYARLSDYARERPGVSARQLQELARVHRALAGLPALEQALLSNALSWSKVREVARVATPASEEGWIARARQLPMRRLEAEVRRRLPDREPDDLPPRRRVVARCRPSVREKWSLTCEMAERMGGARMPAEEVLELASAEVLSAVQVDPAFAHLLEPRPLPSPGSAEPEPAEPEESDPPGPGPHDLLPPRPTAAPPRLLPAEVATLGTGLGEASAFELDRRLRRVVHLEQTLDAAVAPLLRAVTHPDYEWEEDYQPLSVYAPGQLGMSASKARALMRLERAGEVCPELRAAYRKGRLSWVKAHCLLPLLLLDIEGEWRPAWIAWAQRVTVRRLAADVERALLLRAGHEPAFARCKYHPERAQDAIPPDERQMCAPDVDPEATQELVWRVVPEVASLFAAARETLRGLLARERGRWPTDGEVLEVILDHALAAWALRDPAAPRPDPVIERDGYRCAVPGCTSRRNLHDHHVVFRSAGGSDAPANRVTLCAFHHQHCLHAGLLRVRGRAPHDLVFELGLRAGGAPLVRYRSGDVLLPPETATAA